MRRGILSIVISLVLILGGMFPAYVRATPEYQAPDLITETQQEEDLQAAGETATETPVQETGETATEESTQETGDSDGEGEPAVEEPAAESEDTEKKEEIITEEAEVEETEEETVTEEKTEGEKTSQTAVGKAELVQAEMLAETKVSNPVCRLECECSVCKAGNQNAPKVIAEYEVLGAAVKYITENPFYNGNQNNPHLYRLYLLRDYEYVKSLESTYGSSWNFQYATVTIEPDEGIYPDKNQKPIIKRGDSTESLFEVEAGGNLTVKRVVLDGEQKNAGGRLILSKGNLTLDNCELKNNYDTSGTAKGGAVRVESDTTKRFIVKGCVFSGNMVRGQGANGGAISALSCYVNIEDSKFYGNRVEATDSTSGGGGAIYIDGRFRTAVGAEKYVANLILKNTEIKNNSVSCASNLNDLQKLRIGGGGLYVERLAWVKMNTCQVIENSAPTGGGIYLNSGWMDVESVDIQKNSAEKVGGGVTLANSVDVKRFSVRGKVVITDNDAENPQISNFSSNQYPYPANPPEKWADNVFLQNFLLDNSNAAQTISLAGDLEEGSSIGITAIDTFSGDPTTIKTVGRMQINGQFGNALKEKILEETTPQDANSYIEKTEDATFYRGHEYFYRDTNGSDPDELYLYGAPGNVNSAKYGTAAIIWQGVEAPDFSFLKVDETGKSFGAGEATFVIKDAPDGSVLQTVSTTSDGTIAFANLIPGKTYYLYETETKPGYALPSGYWKLEVNASDGKITIESVPGAGTTMPGFENVEGIGWKLKNEPFQQAELPSTGGIGTLPFTAAAAVLICFTACSFRTRKSRGA